MSHWGDNQQGPDFGTSSTPLGHLDGWGELVVDYLDGTADPTQTVTIEAHLAGCPTCAARMVDQREAASVLRSLPLAATPEGLEDRILGEFLFPSQVIPLPEPAKPSLSSLWHRRLRAWVPAAAAVAAVLVGIVAYGLLNPAEQQLASDLQVTSTAAASQGAAPLSAGNEAAPAAETTSDGASAPTTAAAMAETTTTATGAVTTDGSGRDPASGGSTPVIITSRQGMVEALRTSTGPIYVAFTPMAVETEGGSEGETATTDTLDGAGTTDGSPGTSDNEASNERVTSASEGWVEETVAQLKAFTELEPLPASFGLEEPVYAAYLNHDHVSAFVDLLLAIAASVRLDVSMQAEAGEGWDAAPVISEHKNELPVLLSHLLPQPAVVRYSFTTSTLVPTDGSDDETVAPDEAGTHVLTVLFMRP